MKENRHTKQAIVAAFKELMKEKSFDKISISDITSRSYFNRQTFYYHFQDKYELMNYIYYYEIFVPLVTDLNEENYNTKFYEMFTKMKSEQYLYENAVQMNAEYGFVEYLYKVLKELLDLIFENKKAIDIKFYTYGIVGVILDWIKSGMKLSPKELSDWLEELLLDFKRRS